MYTDITLKCKDCGADFVFTAGEQEFYAEKGFTNQPQRCKACRDAKKNAGKSGTTVRMQTRRTARCLLQFAQTAAKRQRFLSSPTTTDPYTAATASQR